MSKCTPVADGTAKTEPFLVCEKTAARLLSISAGTLIAGRFRRQPLLPFVRAGKRSIRYRVADIEDFIKRNTEGMGP
jgi:hypothetical protein